MAGITTPGAARGTHAPEGDARIRDLVAAGYLLRARHELRGLIEGEPAPPIDEVCMLGQLESRLGDPAAAIALLASCQAANPEHVDAALALCDAHVASGQLPDAIRTLRRAASSVVDGALCARLGELLAVDGEFSAADEMFIQALQSNHRKAEMLCRLGQVQLAQGRLSAALVRFAEAIRTDVAEAVRPLANLLQVLAGNAYPMEGISLLCREVQAELLRAAMECERTGSWGMAGYALHAARSFGPHAPELDGALHEVIGRLLGAVGPGALPTITVVTPSFNQARFLEDCMRSVLDAGYPRLEYVVVDGGSTDGSIDVIRRFAPRLARWTSRHDDGPYAALTDAFSSATGDVLTWVNADDRLEPWALAVTAVLFARRDDVAWVTGLPAMIDASGRSIGVDAVHHGWSTRMFAAPMRAVQQEGTFWRRKLWEQAGGRVGAPWRHAGDLDLWMRFIERVPLHELDVSLGRFRQWSGLQRSNQAEYEREVSGLMARFARRVATDADLRQFGPHPLRLSELASSASAAGAKGAHGDALPTS